MSPELLAAIPDDFAEFAVGKTILQLAKHYKRSQCTIVAWRRAKGIPGLKPAPPPRSTTIVRRPPPVGFAAAARSMTMSALRARFGAGKTTIKYWCEVEGVAPLKPANAGWRQPKAAIDVDYRENSLAGKAARYLQKFGPVVRCDANGRVNPQGTHWLRGGRAILTDDELMERARRNGWNPDAWMELAA
jgi:hypothetical protein